VGGWKRGTILDGLRHGKADGQPSSPAGTRENSPRFQSWVCDPIELKVPSGTAEFSFVPGGTRFGFIASNPPLKRWAIIGRPGWDFRGAKPEGRNGVAVVKCFSP